MARKKKAEDVVNTEGWLTTYADLLSLLLCFFVMMYTASVPDDARMQWILRSFANVAGNVVDFVNEDEEIITGLTDEQNLVGPHRAQVDGERPGIPGTLPMTFEDMFNWVSEIVDAHDLSDSVTAEMYEGRLHIRFNDDIMFFPESYELRREGAEALTRIAPGIRAMNRFIASAEVQGHTAPTPPGVSYASWNRIDPWYLSSMRAVTVTQLLDGRLRMVDSDKFTSAGHGPYQPHYAMEENTRNRRVEIVLTRSEYEPQDTQSILDVLQYDYQFPLIADGPLGGRQPHPDFIDRNKKLLSEIQMKYGVDERIFERPNPSPGDGRGFDFLIPAIP
ncbi:MAG: hypothetical protein FWD35_05025 [Oscillospiraceae bacterium]|nr:hypothetical protein [Oscillospiraceae bacterium]